ncbi:MAG: tRNA (N(6)-L-threonylcarbamoyladenosine(37)-C(2))-methylthiotransferase MtaB [Fidelibacterota bacterium]
MSTQPKTIAFHTIGCKLNYAETATLARDFAERGFSVLPPQAEADIYVVNTCSVTENANRDCRKFVRRVRRQNPAATIALVGCYAQLQPERLQQTTGADIVLGTVEKFQLLDALDSLDSSRKPVILRESIDRAETFTASYSAAERTRVFLKIQDGCDYPCTYCTIPLARGKSRSDTIKGVLSHAKTITANGAREIVLTGVNIGDFGAGDTGETFYDLVLALEDQIAVDRIRISSIEPNLLEDRIMDAIQQSEKFVPHFHIPLQSGSDKILNAMKRRYNRELYQDRVNAIRSRLPDACIGGDVIVGFPGETAEDFEDTYQFIMDLDISYLHVFSYSDRPQTPAATYNGAVPPAERMQRSKRLRILSDKKRSLFHDKFVDTQRQVLFEAVKGQYVTGHTDNYILVQVPSSPNHINTIHPVKLTANQGRHMMGEMATTTP